MVFYYFQKSIRKKKRNKPILSENMLLLFSVERGMKDEIKIFNSSNSCLNGASSRL